MSLHLHQPSSPAAWGRGQSLAVFTSPKTFSIGPGSQWVANIFYMPLKNMITDKYKDIYVQLCIVTQNLYMPLYHVVYFWLFSLKCYLIVPRRLSFQFSSLFLLGWLICHTRRIWQEGFTRGLNKFMNDIVINIWV